MNKNNNFFIKLKGDEKIFVYKNSLGVLGNFGFLKLNRVLNLTITKSKLLNLTLNSNFFYKQKILKNINKLSYLSYINKKVFQNFFIVKYGIVKKLKLNGIGFRVYQKNGFLVIKSNLNHLIFVRIPEKVLVKILKGKIIFLSGFEKMKLNDFENIIYSCFIPDSFKGKGVYKDFKLENVKTYTKS